MQQGANAFRPTAGPPAPSHPRAPANASVEAAGPPGLVPWEFAGLLLTYWCNARCAFCYVYSGPHCGGEMSVETALALWSGLDRLAARHGKTMRIHLAGGEPFGDWPRLVATIRAARDAGLTPLEKVETNAFWATDDDRTRARLELLDALGMEKLIVSADIYHQEFVPFERVRRCVETARRVLGRGRVRVRWWDFYNDPTVLRKATATERHAAYQRVLDRNRDRLTGRAAETLAKYLPRRPAAAFRGDHCVKAVLESRHVHVDAYGSIIPGICSGIMLGRATPERPIDQVWQDVAANWRRNPVVDAVVAGGSYELVQRARTFGYQELPTGYASKCHLCTHVRQFLFDRRIWPDAIGPRECYAERDTAQAAPRVPLTHPVSESNVSAT